MAFEPRPGEDELKNKNWPIGESKEFYVHEMIPGEGKYGPYERWMVDYKEHKGIAFFPTGKALELLKDHAVKPGMKFKLTKSVKEVQGRPFNDWKVEVLQ